MTRPLLVTDCDEVLLHFVRHFGEWLDEAHAIDFALDRHDFGGALTRKADGTILAREDVWPLLDGFFVGEMHRQTIVPGAAEALARIGEVADIVVLTNLQDHHNAARVAQLDALGIRHRVVTNQGGKGRPLSALVDEFGPSATVFVDDLPHHHESVAEHRPEVWRLHMVAEPTLAPRIVPAPHAHARIDRWDEAVEWILEKLQS